MLGSAAAQITRIEARQKEYEHHQDKRPGVSTTWAGWQVGLLVGNGANASHAQPALRSLPVSQSDTQKLVYAYHTFAVITYIFQAGNAETRRSLSAPVPLLSSSRLLGFQHGASHLRLQFHVLHDKCPMSNLNNTYCAPT